jgi:hypothetical protein
MNYTNYTSTNTTQILTGGAAAATKPWLDIVLAALAINLVTLWGVTLTAMTRCCTLRNKKWVENLIVPSFAAGTCVKQRG